jgi:hypothetical protein
LELLWMLEKKDCEGGFKKFSTINFKPLLEPVLALMLENAFLRQNEVFEDNSKRWKVVHLLYIIPQVLKHF